MLLGLLCAASVASAQSLVLLEGAHELQLDQVSFPASNSGTLVFRPCQNCGSESLKLTPATVFLAAGSKLAFEEFQRRVLEVKTLTASTAVVPVTVFYDLVSGDVTRVALHYDSVSQ